MRPHARYEDLFLIERLSNTDRAERWLATEPEHGRYVQIKRFNLTRGTHWKAQQAWFALLEQLRLLQCYGAAFTVPIERVAQDSQGRWYIVTPWIKSNPVLPTLAAPHRRPAPCSSAQLPPLILAAALATQSALALGQEHGLPAPIMHGFHDPTALLNTPLGGILTGFDRPVTPGDPSQHPQSEWRDQLAPNAWAPNHYWTLALAQAPHFGQWEPRQDVWALGLLLRHMVLLVQSQHQNPTDTDDADKGDGVPPPHQDPLLDALLDVAQQAQPGDQLPNITLEGFIEALHGIHGSLPTDISQMSDTQALSWLRGQINRGHHDAFMDIFNLSPHLLGSDVVTDYAWEHFGRAFIQDVAQGKGQNNIQARVIASIPQATQSLLGMLDDPDTNGPGRAEAARLLHFNKTHPVTLALVNALNDPWPQVRHRAAQSLQHRPTPIPVGLHMPDSGCTARIQACSFDWDDLEDEETLATGHACRFCVMCERRVVRSNDTNALAHLPQNPPVDLPSGPPAELANDFVRLTWCADDNTETTWLLGPGDHLVFGGPRSPVADLRLEACQGEHILVRMTYQGTVEVSTRCGENPQNHTLPHQTPLARRPYWRPSTYSLAPGTDDIQVMYEGHWQEALIVWRTQAQSNHVRLIHRQNQDHFDQDVRLELSLRGPSMVCMGEPTRPPVQQALPTSPRPLIDLGDTVSPRLRGQIRDDGPFVRPKP